jgi:ADP-heptose:LPS heptosyltransferase
MMLPLLDRLHTEHPEIALEVAVSKSVGSLYRAIPFLEDVHEIDIGKTRPLVRSQYQRIGNMIRYATRHFSKRKYAVCLLPRWGMDPFHSAFLASLTNSTERWGQDSREESGAVDAFFGTRFLMTQAIRGGHGLPEAVRELRLLSESGLIAPFDEIDVATKPIKLLQMIAEASVVNELWARLGFSPEGRFCVIAPGASALFRRWPLGHFVQAAELLDTRFSLKFIALGSQSERDLGVKLEDMSGGRIRSLVGMTSLIETIALINRAKLFLGNDSGPAHISAGLGVPSLIVSVWPQSTPLDKQSAFLRVRPVGPNVYVLQPKSCIAPCTCYCSANVAHCILDVRPEYVLDQACRWLEAV